MVVLAPCRCRGCRTGRPEAGIGSAVPGQGRVVGGGDAGHVESGAVQALRERVDDDCLRGKRRVEQWGVAGAQVQLLRLRLAGTGGEKGPVVAAAARLLLQLRDHEPGQALTAVRRGCPDALELRGARVESLEGAAGDGHAAAQQQHEGAVRQGERLRRVAVELDGGALAEEGAVTAVVLPGEFGEQGLGKRVVCGDVDEGVVAGRGVPVGPASVKQRHGRHPSRQ
jgi:hypothetical protein